MVKKGVNATRWLEWNLKLVLTNKKHRDQHEHARARVCVCNVNVRVSSMMFLFEGVGGVWKSWTKDSLVGEGYLGNVRYPIPLIIVPLLRQKVLRGGKCPFKSATIVSSSHFSSPFLSTSRQRANKVHVSLPSSLICFFFLPLIYFITFLFHS